MRRFLMLALPAFLVGCDDPTIISHVERRGNLDSKSLWTMQQGGGVPVEVHGNPFSAVAVEDLVAALRPPNGTSQEVRFRLVPPGLVANSHVRRLVLHFNATGAPHTPHDCDRSEEVGTQGVLGAGYTVNVSFCAGERWLGQAYLRALETPDNDVEAFVSAMKRVFREVLIANE